MIERCVSLRKDGRPCQGVGLFNHPERNGLVCDAHRPDGPGSERWKAAMTVQAPSYLLEEYNRQRKALAVSLSDDGLQALLEELRTFRNGERLSRKTRKILDNILSEDTHRKASR
jgi:hypothetical protein